MGPRTMSSVADVPFLDLAAQHAEIAVELDEAWAKITAANSFIGGSYVGDFESEFADFCGVKECVGVANGTDALELILRGLDLREGDEVIVPANTFVATIEAIVAVGSTPVFVDVEDDTLLVAAANIEAAITERTVAAIAVHLYGQMPDMDAISEVTERAGIALVEDAAQAHGARWLDKRAGSFGAAAAFSFYPGKNLGAFGDAGAITTNNAELSERIRSLADHGRRMGTRHEHDLSGRNSRLDALQAAVLSIKLRRLDDWNASRRAAADLYRKLLDATNCRVLHSDPRSTPVHHLEIVRVPQRDQVLNALDAHGIGWGLHYPIPSHQQTPFERFARTPQPVTEAAAGEIVSVPMFPTITPHEVERVCEVLLDATQGSASGTRS
jgi:dTDP-4-amino-4,6-dideoxygalactose transaminase